MNSFSARVVCEQWCEGIVYSAGLWSNGTHAKDEIEMEGVSNKDWYIYTCANRRFANPANLVGADDGTGGGRWGQGSLPRLGQLEGRHNGHGTEERCEPVRPL